MSSFRDLRPANSKIPRVLFTNELVTGPPAQAMIQRAGDLFTSYAPVILDNASGAGVVTALLQQRASEEGASEMLKIIAADKAPSMISTLETRVQESGWANVEVMQFDQANMPLLDGSVDHVFTNFGIFFSPDDATVLRQIHRVLKPGGVVGLTSWKLIAWWPMAQAALRTYLPEAPPLQDAQALFSMGWNDAEYVEKKLVDAGFEKVTVEEFRFAPMIRPDEFGEATGELVKLATMRMWDEEARNAFGDGIRGAITTYLQDTYHDGVWDGEMTALISLGRK